MDLTLVIMAAGIGSRYGGIKQLDEIGPSGETLMDYSIYDAYRAGFNKVVFIIRRDLKPAFDEHYEKRFIGKIEIDYAYQDEFKKHEEGLDVTRTKPWGTGHAMLSASGKIHSPFAILNADDFYGSSAFTSIAGALNNINNEGTYFLVGYRLKNTLSEFGSVSRGLCKLDPDNFLTGVTELTKIFKNEDSIVYEENGEIKQLNDNDLVSMNFWGFTPAVFTKLNNRFKDFILNNHANPKAEFYIPAFVDDLIKNNDARVKVLIAEETWLGVTYREDREFVMNKIQLMIKSGMYPQRLG